MKRVGEADTSIHGESAKYKVVELDARGRNRVAEGVVSLRKEFGEVVKEDEEDSLSSDVECTSGVGKLSFAKEGCEETHESDQLTKERGPSLCIEGSVRERMNQISRQSVGRTSRSSTANNFGMNSR